MKVFINERILKTGELWEPASREEFDENIIELIKLIECLPFLIDCEGYYNSAGINEVIKNLEFINEYEEYLSSNIINLLRSTIFNTNLKDWTQEKKHRSDHNYLIQFGNGFKPYLINNTSISEATEYKYDKNNSIILNFSSSDFIGAEIVYINRVNANPPFDMNLISIYGIRTTGQIIKYFLKNREEFVFNLNPKHGENHEKVIKSKYGDTISPLECTKEDANSLLKKSVRYIKEKELYSYDKSRDKYIVFKYDNTVNPKTYHGYHPHDQDEIPDKVKKIIQSNINDLG